MTVTVSPVGFEHHRDALGIGEAAPRLSWIVEAAPTGWAQASYELETASGETVRVHSSESVLVPWPFAELRSRERVRVRVRVTGEDSSVSDWSDWAAVEAGLLEPVDWVARLVTPGAGTPALLRHTAELRAKPVRSARVYVTAHGLYQLEIDGRRVGDDELAPGWTAYESRLRYQTYDVTDLVRGGRTTIGAWLADGWWRGYLGPDGRREFYGTEPGLLAQLEVEFEDGERRVIATGGDWRTAAGPILSADLYNGEHFDARLLEMDWSTAGGPVDGWKTVTASEIDIARLVAPDGPPVRVTETVPVVDVTTSPSGRTILDFGQNLVGRLRISVSGAAGDTVVLRHAEVLAAGELATEPLRGAKATDTYVLRGEGVEQWAPRFTFHGFRYAEVNGWPGEFDPSAVVAEVLHSDLERTGWFTTSDPMVNRLHQNIVWGMRGNFVDIPTDCPQRDERLGWTGDVQVFAPTAEYLFDTAGFLTSWLKDLTAEQAHYGGTPMVVPAVTTGYNGPMAGWGDAATVVPWTVYQATGDLGVLARQFDSMLSWTTEVEAAAGPDRIWCAGYQFGDWLDPTAPAGRPEASATYPEIVATAYFARSARIAADAAVLLRRPEAERLAALAEEVATAFRREYITASGRILSDSATAYALALQFDLVDNEAARIRAGDRLAEIVRSDGYTIATGFIGTPLICDALSRNGHLDTAYRLLLQTKAPSWLYSVDQGATTIWERWDALLPDGTVNPSGMTSFNHYAFGAVGDWLHRIVAGLAPAAPGYRRIRIAPQPPRRGLTSASARLKTPYGTAESGWVLRDGALRLVVRVPVGVAAEVVLPSGARQVVGHGEHEFSETFDVDQEAHATITVDTPLGTLMESSEAMAVLTTVITKHVPEAGEHRPSALRGQDAITPRQIAAMLPRPDAVLADLECGFAAISAGESVPGDVLLATSQ